MILMLPQSCDPGYGALGVQLGVPTVTKQAEDFGYSLYGSKSPYVPGLDLPGVVPSVFSALPTRRPGLSGPERHRAVRRPGHPVAERAGGRRHRQRRVSS